MVQVRYDEGVAIHIGPEPCVVVREGGGEASAGERIGQPSSRERKTGPGRRRRSHGGRQHGRARDECSTGPAWSKTLACADAPCAGTGRSRLWPSLGLDGPHREGEEPKPMMDAGEKSDSAIVATKPTNNAGRPVAEPVERRAETKGNAGQQRTRRAQDRASVSQALDRIRQATRHRRKERFTALFHHLSPEMPRTSTIGSRTCMHGSNGERTGRCHHDDGTSRKRIVTIARSRWPLSRTRSSRGRRPLC